MSNANNLRELLNPCGIAIVGASTDPSRPGSQTISALKQYGFDGGIFPVNPKYPEIGGYRCFATLGDITDPCDLAVIALPAQQVPGVIAQCADRGIRFAVVLGGGFREAGEEGIKIEAAMLHTARERGVRLVGPNCLGFVNVHTRAYACFGSLTRPPQLAPGPVSVVLQSASFGMSMVIQCAAAGIGFRYVVTSGNESDITAPELIDAYVNDPGTKVVLAYLEGVNDGRALMRAAHHALAKRKPLIILKAGNTEQGKRAAASHTANLTGNYDIYRAAFRQCGVIEVNDIHEAVDMTCCLVAGRLPRGRRIAVIGGSGGAAAMFADQADPTGLVIPPLADTTTTVLKETLPALSSLKNPIDYTAGYPREGRGLDFHRAFNAVIHDPGIDQLAVMFAAAGRNQLSYGGEVLTKIAASSDKPVIVFSGMTEALAPEGLASLSNAGIPVLSSPKRVATAMAKLADYAAALDHARVAQPPDNPSTVEVPVGATVLNELQSKRIVASAGLRVTQDTVLPLEPEAVHCADIKFPVALKILSPDIPHKTDIGAVRLNVADTAGLIAAAATIVANARRAAPHARLDGLLASEMVFGAAEVIIGVVNDAAFGPVVAIGLGGILAETLHDVAYRIAPFGEAEAHAMLNELRARSIFGVVRGRPALDTTALVAALVSISGLAWQLRDRLVEMDINPIIVMAQGQGIVAADALLVLRPNAGG